MSFFTLLVLASGESFAPVDLAALELYGIKSIEVYRANSGWLLCHRGDGPALVMVDQDGNPTATYRIAGDGPFDLHRPWVFGIRGDEIFVRTSHFATAIFNTDLKPIRPGPGLSKELGHPGQSGVWLTKGLFLRPLLFSDDGLVQALFLKEKNWAAGRIFLQNFRANPRDGYLHGNHGDLHIAFPSPIYEDPGTYRVDLFLLAMEKGEPEFQTLPPLEGTLGEVPPVFPNLHFARVKTPRALLGGACRTPTGFIVQIISRDPADGETLNFWWDFYDKDGVFQNREAVGSRFLMSAKNDPAVFVLDIEEETLSRLY